jgi:hypothetical protein
MNLSRRRVLQGAFGVTLALPVLESLTGLGPKAFAKAARDRFFIVVRAGDGIVQEPEGGPARFWPPALGALTTTGLKQATNRAVSELLT